jgi:hypothetical protein
MLLMHVGHLLENMVGMDLIHELFLVVMHVMKDLSIWGESNMG